MGQCPAGMARARQRRPGAPGACVAGEMADGRSVGYMLLFGSWLGFTLAVSLQEVLWRRGDVWRFAFEYVT